MTGTQQWTIERAGRGAQSDVMRLLEGQYAEHQIDFEAAWLAQVVAQLVADTDAGTLLLVRDAAGRAVALAAASFITSLEEGGRVAWLDELYVLPELRGAGLGGALVERVCALATAAGCRAVELEVTDDHRRAENLYQRAGFANRQRSRWVRRLNPPAARRAAAVLDHLSLGVNELARSRAFYDAALAPLGLVAYPQRSGDIGYGPSGPEPVEGFAFYIGFEDPAAARPVQPSAGFHLALRAPSCAAVREFHAAALAAGGKDYGPPGLRPRYHREYYAAFALDPDGHVIEAVCHTPDVRGPLEPL